ncbi:SGNH/GDSL hydrolase family protein [Candidatus Aminicenantes bacterium AC-335-A11]|jgi:lysophospholipase L1-like esterase|nr:SGNH/GDSL hydrolase family protein [SCandidatus Aminicenantes bacterium Aminicenantia_JdfR_composite]MCP2597419.1 SGNH/GDSL hydrolase family protein [Candidatus Aminicenantes bacterium AC-335-G13]MCP2618886.1 SGNH/GDSL hydrolase family protein [Candidatus Aminicenantes bacterium AC-335-A11]
MVKNRKKIKILAFFLLVSIFQISGCSSKPKTVIIFCAGDSLTNSLYPSFLKNKLISEGIRARVYNFGQNGNNSGQYLRFLIRNKKWMKEKHPDFVLLQLGTNDVRMDSDFTPTHKFYLNMKKIISIFKKFKNRQGKNTKILIATIPPLPRQIKFPFTEESRERIQIEINPTIRKIAIEENLTLVDNYSLFIKNPDLLPDVHPNEKGYKAMAENWYSELKKLIK